MLSWILVCWHLVCKASRMPKLFVWLLQMSCLLWKVSFCVFAFKRCLCLWFTLQISHCGQQNSLCEPMRRWSHHPTWGGMRRSKHQKWRRMRPELQGWEGLRVFLHQSEFMQVTVQGFDLETQLRVQSGGEEQVQILVFAFPRPSCVSVPGLGKILAFEHFGILRVRYAWLCFIFLRSIDSGDFRVVWLRTVFGRNDCVG